MSINDKRNTDPVSPYLRRVSDDMMATNVIQHLSVNNIAALHTMAPKILNMLNASGASGDALRVSLVSPGIMNGNTAATDIQLTFAAHLQDLGDVDRQASVAQVGTDGVDIGHILIFSNEQDKYITRQLQGHASLGTGGVLTLSEDSVGITNLNLTGDGGEGSILFQSNSGGKLSFNQPYLTHFNDVTVTGTPSVGQIMVYGDNSSFHNKTVSGDIIITQAGVATIVDDAVGLDELDIDKSIAQDEWIIGVTGSGSELGYYTRTIDIDEIPGPHAGTTAIMVHDGAAAYFMEGIEIPNLGPNIMGDTHGVVRPLGAPSDQQLLGVATGPDGVLRWKWLNPIDIGTGATGIGQLEEVSFTPGSTAPGAGRGEIFIGDDQGAYVNLPIIGDITVQPPPYSSAGVTFSVTNISGLSDDFIVNSKLVHKGITLAMGDGLTWSIGTYSDNDPQIELGEARELKLELDGTYLGFSGGQLGLCAASINTSALSDDAVETIKINNLAVTTAKIAASAVTNDKLANKTLVFIMDSGETKTLTLGDSNIGFLTSSDITQSTWESQAGTAAASSLYTQDVGGEFSTQVRIAGATNAASDSDRPQYRGVASFSSDTFTVSAQGHVTITDDALSGNYLPDDVITADHIADDVIGRNHLNLNTEGSDGDILVRRTGNDFDWVAPSTVAVSMDLDDLGDVDVANPAEGDVVRWNGTAWKDHILAHYDLAAISSNKILGRGSVGGAPEAMSASTVKSVLNAGSGSLNADTLGNIAYDKFFRADRGSNVTQQMDGPCQIAGSMILGKGLGDVTDGTDISMGSQGWINARHNINIGSGESIRFFSDSDNLKNLSLSELSTEAVPHHSACTMSLYLGMVGINTTTPIYWMGDNYSPGMQIVGGGYRSDGVRNGFWLYHDNWPSMAMVSNREDTNYTNDINGVPAANSLRVLITDEATDINRYNEMNPENSCLICDEYILLQGDPGVGDDHGNPRIALSTRNVSNTTRHMYFYMNDTDENVNDNQLFFRYYRGDTPAHEGGSSQWAGFEFKTTFTTSGNRTDMWPLWFSPEKFSGATGALPTGRHAVVVDDTNLLVISGKGTDGSGIEAGKPGLLIDSSHDDDQYGHQTAFIRLGESAIGAGGQAALNIVYTGDGYSHMYMGPMSESGSFAVDDHTAPFTGNVMNSGNYRGESGIIQMFYIQPWIGMHAANGLYLYKDIDDYSNNQVTNANGYGMHLPFAGIRIGSCWLNTTGAWSPSTIIFGDSGSDVTHDVTDVSSPRTTLGRYEKWLGDNDRDGAFVISAGWGYIKPSGEDGVSPKGLVNSTKGASSLFLGETSVAMLSVSDADKWISGGDEFSNDAYVQVEGKKYSGRDMTRITIQADEVVHKRSDGSRRNVSGIVDILTTDYINGPYRYDFRQWPTPVDRGRDSVPNTPVVYDGPEGHQMDLLNHGNIVGYDGPWKEITSSEEETGSIVPNRRSYKSSPYRRHLGWHRYVGNDRPNDKYWWGDTNVRESTWDGRTYGSTNNPEVTWKQGKYRRVRVSMKNMWLSGDYGPDAISYQVRLAGDWYGHVGRYEIETTANTNIYDSVLHSGVPAQHYPQMIDSMQDVGGDNYIDPAWHDKSIFCVPMGTTYTQWSWGLSCHLPMHYMLDIAYDDPCPYIMHSWMFGAGKVFVEGMSHFGHGHGRSVDDYMLGGWYKWLSNEVCARAYWNDFNRLRLHKGFDPSITSADIDGIRLTAHCCNESALQLDGIRVEGLEW